MQSIQLDCSSLPRSICLDKGDLPNSIYIDGRDFLIQLNQSFQEMGHMFEGLIGTLKEEITVEQAVKVLTKALTQDSSFWESYKANISVCMQDEMHDTIAKYGFISEGNLKYVCDKAAERFLRLWCIDANSK